MWAVISGILGILGFIISLINLIQYLMSRRINLEIQIRECTLRQYAKGQKKLTLHYRANNKSNLPITITDLQIVINSRVYDESLYTFEIFAYKHTIDDIVEYVPTYNEHLPINLPMLSSHAGYLVFLVPEDTPENVCKDLTLKIRTNRHKEVQRSFVPNELVVLRRTLPKKFCKNHSEQDKQGVQKKFVFPAFPFFCLLTFNHLFVSFVALHPQYNVI